MAESKFDQIFEKARVEPPAAADITPSGRRDEKSTPVPIRPTKALGRPPGKRSDPAWKQFSVLLKKETQRQAANILREREQGMDFSGLVQILLENWTKRQQS